MFVSLCIHQRASWTYPPQVFNSVHLFNKFVRSRFTISSFFSVTIRPRFTAAKIKLGEDSPSWFAFLGQDSLPNEQNNKTIKHPFVQDSLCFRCKNSTCSKINYVKIHHSQKLHLKIRCREGIKSLTIEEGEFKVPIDDCINMSICTADCEKACTRELLPKCGTDGTTYNNQCLLEVAICKDPSLQLSSDGPCPPPPGILNFRSSVLTLVFVSEYYKILVCVKCFDTILQVDYQFLKRGSWANLDVHCTHMPQGKEQ